MSTTTLNNEKKKLLIPQLRFQGFEGEWEKKKLGDVGKIRMCKRVFSYETSETGEIPFYKIGTFGKEADAYITNELHFSYRERFSFPKIGEILISASGTLGRTVVYDGKPAYFQDSNIVWIDNNEKVITNSFLYYIYQIVKYDSEGGTIQRLYNSIISNTKFNRPTLPEQQKIASFLSAVDEKIQQLSRKKELLEQYKKGVMQQLFSGKLRFKDENGKDYVDWEEKKLGEFVNERVKYPEDDCPLYSLTIENGMIPKSARYERSFLVKDAAKAYKIMIQDDFAFNPMNLRFGALARLKVDETVGVSKYYNIFYCNSKVNKLYLEKFLTNYNMIQYYNKMATGSLEEKKRVHYLDFIKFKFLFPCLEEQQKIAAFLSSVDAKIESTSQQIIQTQSFKKGLLQQLFV